MTSLTIHTIPVGPLATNCYFVGRRGGNRCLIIDPGDEATVLCETLEKKKLTPELILLTHSHIDHFVALEELLNSYPNIEIACHRCCAERIVDPLANYSLTLFGRAITSPKPHRLLTDREECRAADLVFSAYYLPGHDEGHLVYFFPEGPALFSGDTIFAGGIGRSDLPGGDHARLVEGITTLLRILPSDTAIYPGHGPSTTVKRESQTNPFLVSKFR